jgi:hypothetical protein
MLQAQEPFRLVTTVPNKTRCDGDRVGHGFAHARACTLHHLCSDFSLFRSLFHKVERERDKSAVSSTVTAHRKKVWLFENVMPTLGTPKNEEVFINTSIQFMNYRCIPVQHILASRAPHQFYIGISSPTFDCRTSVC